MAVTLLDDLCVEASVVHKVDICQQPVVFIPLLPVIFQPDRLTFYHFPGECRGFLAKVLDWRVRPNRFRGVHTNEPDFFTVTQADGIAVNYSGACEGLSMGAGGRKEQKELGKIQDVIRFYPQFEHEIPYITEQHLG